ncbi:rhomboid family intramembrane serine protease [Granulicatella seriolae]|uniref:Rhomboid family intramembrane serine protease n=1 Tax=Granulicatella seriolae TaxID=2967226 RepID=A0ABT1WKI7_9LACT|nr:rhomboid family intramembrane serine protease [Granulicatella seriolae]
MNPWKRDRYIRTIKENISAANIFLLIQVVLFILMSFAGGSTDVRVLVNFGAKFNPYIQLGEYWRFITPIFLHIGFEHLFMNSILLYFLGNQLENIIGRWRFATLYLLSGILGNLMSFAFSTAVSAGASTSLFGLFGLIIYLSYKHSYIYSFRQLGATYGFLIAINVVFGFFGGNIDVYGHMGGLIGGFLIAGVISFRGDRRTTSLQRLIFAVAYILIAGAFFVLGMGRGY